MRGRVERGRHREEGRKGKTGRLSARSLSIPSTPSFLPILALLVLLAGGCDAETPSEPGLSDSLMVEVLVGVHLADARASRTSEPRDSLRAVALAGLGTDTVAFHRALDYFAHHPKAYQPLYDRALDRLLDERRSAAE